MPTNLFHRAFGRADHPHVVFLHGGPGSNCYQFERSTAQQMADRGNYVVTYDQRGSGRSPAGQPGDFTFANAARDLRELIESLGLRAPVLVGHSFGGFLSLHFARLHPGMAKGVVMLGSPIEFREAYRTMVKRVFWEYDRVYDLRSKADVARLWARMFPGEPIEDPMFMDAFQVLAKRDGSAALRQVDIEDLWNHVLKTQLDFPPFAARSPESQRLYFSMFGGPEGYLMLDFKPEPRRYFHENEAGYVDRDEDNLRLLEQVSSTLPIHAIFGWMDRLFSRDQVDRIERTLGGGHFSYLGKNGHYSAGHTSYVDLNREFVAALSNHLAAIRAA